MQKGSYRQPSRPWFDDLLAEVRSDLTAEELSELADANRCEPDYGGAFDGFTVTSDADPGL